MHGIIPTNNLCELRRRRRRYRCSQLLDDIDAVVNALVVILSRASQIACGRKTPARTARTLSPVTFHDVLERYLELSSRAKEASYNLQLCLGITDTSGSVVDVDDHEGVADAFQECCEVLKSGEILENELKKVVH